MEGLAFSLGKEEEKVSLEDFYDLVIFGGDLPALRLQFMRQGQESKRSLLKRKKSEAVEQAKKFGAIVYRGTPTDVQLKKPPRTFTLDGKTVSCNSIIIATGTSPKKLNVPGEEKLKGRGVSYCATCDGPIYANEDIAVIGCGNSGLQEGLFILKFVKSITFVEFLPEIRAEKILLYAKI
ncbi:MAG: FAD-dependent oxidoreductase [Deltaproteobacteria bacterium]|nr:FAD-dependent oxidoreductase [Deltaproteobacteria bacterium]